jgi:hypothetical protein
MRQRVGSVWAHQRGETSNRADRVTDGAPRHRPRTRHGLSTEQESVLELQRLAGNMAVANALTGGRSAEGVTSIDRMELTREAVNPENGIKSIRERTENKSTIALTRRTIIDEPPIMRPEPATKGPGGFTTRTQKIGAIPEPKIEEWWPKEGRYKTANDAYLDVSHDWEKKLEKGEDEHRDDAKLAWELTWKKVKDTINSFAEKPGPPEATPDAAKDALWRRYVAALPKDLQPEGRTPSDAKQRDVLAVEPGSFFAWMWELTIARDGRMYHETHAAPAKDPKNPPKDAIVEEIAPASQFLVPGPLSPAFIEEIRVKYAPRKVIQGSKLKAGGGDQGKQG